LDSSRYLTPIGSYLRRTSLDELPQLLSILCGDLTSLAPGRRSSIRTILKALRTDCGRSSLVPAHRLAQINGRDSLPIPVKCGTTLNTFKDSLSALISGLSP